MTGDRPVRVLEEKGVAYAARRLGCSVQGIYRLVEARQLPYVNVGSSNSKRRPTLRFLDEDLDAFITHRRVAALPPPNEKTPELTLVSRGRYR